VGLGGTSSLPAVWEFDWGTTEPRSTQKLPVRTTRSVRVAPTYWEEHCSECAVPECYSTCNLYTPRRDGGCHRFVGGIRRIPDAAGLYGDGARIRFERWGKLETLIPRSTCSPTTYLVARLLERMIRVTEHMLGSRWARLRLVKSWKYRRGKLVALMGSQRADWARCHLELVVENLQSEVGLSVELVDHNVGLSRAALRIPAGISHHHLSAQELGIRCDRTGEYLRIMGDGDSSYELGFLRLEILQAAECLMSAPTEFVKCVVWDLDDTLWNGTLLEDGPDRLTLRQGLSEALQILDERGILHAIASKNSYEDVVPVLSRLGVWDYFVASAVSWGRKSAGLEHIARTLNIGTDSLLLVDNSEFERAEVASQHPEVRLAHPDDIRALVSESFLDPPTNRESHLRRYRYLQDAHRGMQLQDSGLGHVEFLRSCEFVLSLDVDLSDAQVDRMVELLARSNQLNLSSRRFDREEFLASRSPTSLWVAGTCRDRFGDYGLVLAARVAVSESALEIADLAVSCRIAEKSVENAFFEWLRIEALATGRSRVGAVFVPSARNGPLDKALRTCGFSSTPGGTGMHIEASVPVPRSDIVRVTGRLLPGS